MADPKALADALADVVLETERNGEDLADDLDAVANAIAFLRSLEDRGEVHRTGDPHTEVVCMYVNVTGLDEGKRVFVQEVE